MTVLRESAASQTSGRSNAQIQQSGASVAGPDYNRFSDGGTDSAASGLVASLFNLGSKVAARQQVINEEEAYVQGAAARARGESESELQADPTTRAWATAGWRDTAGRLQMADYEAKLASDMPKLRELSPEQFESELAARRRALEPSFQGMSRQQRSTILGQLLTSDRAVIKKHQNEHAKFIMDQQITALQTGMSVRMQKLNAAKDNIATYSSEADAAFTYMHSSIWANPNMTPELRQKLTTEAALYALGSDNAMLLERMRDIAVPLPDGGQGTMLNQLAWDDQVKIGTALRESQKRTEGLRTMQYQHDLALVRANFDNPTVPMPTAEEFAGQVRKGVDLGVVSSSEVESLFKGYYTAAAKRNAQGSGAAAYAAGDIQTLSNLGLTSDEGLEAFVKQAQQAQLPVGDIADNLISVGINTGQANAFKQLGRLVAPAVAQLGLKGTLDPGQSEMIQRVMGAIDTSIAQGQPGALASVLSGMSAEEQDKLLLMREYMRTIPDPEQAAIKAATNIEASNRYTPEQRAEIARGRATEDAAIVQELDERQVSGSVWGALKGFFSQDAANAQKIRPRRGWFEDPTTTQEALAGTRNAVAEELAYIGRESPLLDADSRRSKALAAVAGRTILTDSAGPLTIPRGADMQAYFQVPQNVGPERIGKALDEFMQPLRAEGDSLHFSPQANGTLSYTLRNGSGQVTGMGEVQASEVGKVVEAQREREAAKANIYMGAGSTRGNTGGAQVTFNGTNTAGVDPALMHRYRNNLVDNEGIRDTVYTDTVGMTTVGVGIAKTNQFYPTPGPDGKITKQQLDESFMKASNAAAASAVQAQAQFQLKGDHWFELLAEIGYQSGPGFRSNRTYVEALEHAALGEKDKAVEAFKKTGVYRNSGRERQEHYLKLLNRAL